MVVVKNVALKIRCIEELVPLERLDESASLLVDKIASNTPLTAKNTNHLVRISGNVASEMGSVWQADQQVYCFSTKNAWEGIDVVKQKRTPKFSGQ